MEEYCGKIDIFFFFYKQGKTSDAYSGLSFTVQINTPTAGDTSMPRHLLWCVLCECVHGVPADVCVNEDKFPDPAEDLGHAGLQLYAAQRVHAQVEEVQVGDVGHDGADLATHKH